MFGRKTIRDEYAQAVAEIRGGSRRMPRHDVPAHLRGKHAIRAADPIEEHAFREFAWLGAALDHGTGEAWSFEETSDTMRRAHYLESPEYGRRWTVYYNALKVGWMEVSPQPIKLLGSIQEYVADPNACLDMELSFLRFMPHREVATLLANAALLMESEEGGYPAARGRASVKALEAMTEHLWDVMSAGDEYLPDLFFSVEGSYQVYRERVAHWRSSGFDPVRASLATR